MLLLFKTTIFFQLLSVLFLSPTTNGARILCLFPFNGRSHFIMFEAICKGLARRGHQVDMISHFPTKIPVPNYEDVMVLNDTRHEISVDMAFNMRFGLMRHVAGPYGMAVCKYLQYMQDFIKDVSKKPTYDILLTEAFGASCYMGFHYVLKIPMVLLSSALEYRHVNMAVGNPSNYAVFPSVYLDQPTLRGFWDRLLNFVSTEWYTQEFFYYSKPQEEVMRKYLGNDLPGLRELERNASLVLVNSHHSFYGIRPTVPALVEVGGVHIGEDKATLTPDLEKWLDEAEDGVVYFTLGSFIKIETLPKENILALYASFSRLSPIKVLMKISDKEALPPGLPRNVLIKEWIPQQPVLRHKNLLVFMSHGGLMGSQEAVHHGVPILGIPVFADQMRNINILVDKGMARLVNLDAINEKNIDEALDALLKDPNYKKAAKRASVLFKDRPMSALDTSIYWIEYILRNGQNSLRTPAVDMPWWQLYSLDVFGFLLSLVVLVVYLFLFSLKMAIRMFRKLYSRKANISKKKKK